MLLVPAKKIRLNCRYKVLHCPYFSLNYYSLNHVKKCMQVNFYPHTKEIHSYLHFLDHKYELCLWLVSICRTLILNSYHNGGWEATQKMPCKFALDTLLTLMLKTQYLLWKWVQFKKWLKRPQVWTKCMWWMSQSSNLAPRNWALSIEPFQSCLTETQLRTQHRTWLSPTRRFNKMQSE